MKVMKSRVLIIMLMIVGNVYTGFKVGIPIIDNPPAEYFANFTSNCTIEEPQPHRNTKGKVTFSYSLSEYISGIEWVAFVLCAPDRKLVRSNAWVILGKDLMLHNPALLRTVMVKVDKPAILQDFITRIITDPPLQFSTTMCTGTTEWYLKMVGEHAVYRSNRKIPGLGYCPRF
jgi:hypothetical protein